MSERPKSVTQLCWILIVMSGILVIFINPLELLNKSPGQIMMGLIPLALAIGGIICGIAMLNGQNWARVLLIGLQLIRLINSIIYFIITKEHVSQIGEEFFFLSIIGFFLFRREANEYFKVNYFKIKKSEKESEAKNTKMPLPIARVDSPATGDTGPRDNLFHEAIQNMNNESDAEPMIYKKSLSIVLVDSQNLGDAGPGGSSFQEAIQNINKKNDAAATCCFEAALKTGLSALHQGYAHASLGQIHVRADNIEKAFEEFSKVMNFKEALYESIHTAVLYLSIVCRELGKPGAVNILEQLKYKTSGKINTSLSPETAERVRQLTINNKSHLLERCGTSVISKDNGNNSKNWQEKDNRGTRQYTSQEAVAFWLARNISQKFEPFLLYVFESEEDARNALLHTGIIYNSEDNGKLICTETLTFGYYRRDDGKYEAILCGDDLTHDLWKKSKECFIKHGGILNNQQEPVNKIDPVGPTTVADIQKVKFLREERSSANGQIGIYHVHAAPDAQSAKAFLEQNPVNQKFFFLVVETPEGNYCRDIAGTYKE